MKIKAIIFLLFILAFLVLPAHAQGAEPPIPLPPSGGNYVLDQLDWLTNEQEARINSIIQGLDKDGVAEIGVVTLNDCGSDKRAFRKSLFDTWGIGHADDSDGLLILACWYGGDPSRRSIEQLYGRGLNGILTSKETDEVAQDHFVFYFQRDKPGDGLVEMVRTYNALLRKAAASPHPSNPIGQYILGLDDGTIFTFAMLLVAGLLLLLNQYLPRSVRDRIEDWSRLRGDRWNDRDGDGFGGGSSEGGGGSSTRF